MIHTSFHRTTWYVIATGLIVIVLVGSMLSINRDTVRAQQTVTCSATYTVQPGDDLYQLSLRYGVTIAALQFANNIANPNLIFVGQVLCIPVATAPNQIPVETIIPVLLTPTLTNIGGTPTSAEADIGVEPPVNAIGNFLEICSICSSRDINVTQRQFRQNTLVCASIKPVPASGLLGWYRVNSEWCSWYPSF
jgi:LysM repeat protein